MQPAASRMTFTTSRNAIGPNALMNSQSAMACGICSWVSRNVKSTALVMM